MGDWSAKDLGAIGTGASFVCTVLYLLGYSAGAGVNLFPFFALEDYAREAIVWLPSILFGVGLGALAEIVLRRLEHGLSEEEILASSRKPASTRRARRLPWRVTLAVGVLVGPINAIYYDLGVVRKPELWYAWLISGPCLWLLFLAWYATVPRLVEGWTRRRYVLATAVPTLLIVSFFYGLALGSGARPLLLPNAEAQILVRQPPSPIIGRTLFVLNNFVIVREKRTDQLVVIQKTEVVSLRPVTPDLDSR